MSGVPKKRLLENPLASGLSVPLAIVSIGAVLIFGITKMLSTERSYRELVGEMQSKTFGNKWIAAYELSKHISSASIPEEDIPWLIDNLSSVYGASEDARTRSFIIVALGALKHTKAVALIEQALDDEDGNVVFHAVVALANIGEPGRLDPTKLEALLESQDTAIVHAAILALGTHSPPSAEPKLVGKLSDADKTIRYAAATALVAYKSESALTVIGEILRLKPDKSALDLFALKMNVLNALQKSGWRRLDGQLEAMVEGEPDIRLVAKAREILGR